MCIYLTNCTSFLLLQNIHTFNIHVYNEYKQYIYTVSLNITTAIKNVKLTKGRKIWISLQSNVHFISFTTPHYFFTTPRYFFTTPRYCLDNSTFLPWQLNVIAFTNLRYRLHKSTLLPWQLHVTALTTPVIIPLHRLKYYEFRMIERNRESDRGEVKSHLRLRIFILSLWKLYISFNAI